MDNANENTEYLSASGFSRLKEELSILKDKKRKEVAERLEYAKSLGDLSENAEYQEAKEEQQFVEGRIADLEDILSRAVLISHPASASVVNIGSTVITKKEGSENEDSYFIVGREEADPSQNRISNESPLGRALIGKQRGDVVVIHTPKGEIAYQILDIQ
ncbi:transcription elongation factor GreA [Candidatus Giovannonibacteria bacterium RIFCSPLOWO2_02_FULL_43_11b]|uniref:Transcription elongation factor GreA n=1 Tax=Candidatus Giovannonibacteria bacterium RIFCSPHIGHO2_12_FULL_43_15 TaxID=1798341 RepID=A0A1F5WNR5_9BACT|nr:MAG: transcription elongation factor GreA [Candidatus Giovannonibacteria bacterium RIFCSPHIGHO2_01_FULL_43_100]OGF66036.1 MAG: transcription elongation factor GreA [Candidatus Giovannonibacteria bacterium RIFCSPHIGHO2_02_FULL_43_32]OGF77303.1 MAG: transcription elongation factor GreA [Candidatus Giovannonibacteria bacterium RIFCSPHIGHO2_12_FULL_43_15]OGF78024.1 MAG: transcription elongation factor GreA [Candidatus Giovannonibacteria bacterium RIFCSPLOWO2_01_FULL_43_60]OGF89747.1 MAG: transcr